VIVVPMFAPNTIGIALVRVRQLDATKLTTRDVVNEELWTMLVTRMPVNNATKGFVVIEMSDWEKPPPNILNEKDINFMLKRKKYKNTSE